MRRWLWLLVILLIVALAAVEHHSPSSIKSTPTRGVTPPLQIKYATIRFFGQDGNPVEVNVTYSVNGHETTVSGYGTVRIPENADYAVAYAKGYIPVKITAIVNGRRVILPKDPTKIHVTIKFNGCTHVFLAPKNAPLTEEYNCDTKIQLPEGVYQYATTDVNGCITTKGTATLLKNTVVNIGKGAACRSVRVYVADAETGNPLQAVITLREENTAVSFPCDGNCNVGVPKNGADVYAWLPGYLRGYTHIYTEKNAQILLNKAISGENILIKTNGNQLAITDRDGIVIYYGREGDANLFLPDGSYYAFAERWPITTRVFVRVPGSNKVSITVQPEDAEITLTSGEQLYVNDIPTCKGPKTCTVPALTALRVVYPHGEQNLFVALPGEERII